MEKLDGRSAQDTGKQWAWEPSSREVGTKTPGVYSKKVGNKSNARSSGQAKDMCKKAKLIIFESIDVAERR